MLTTSEIRIRDPFILSDASNHTYFLYGTTDENVWEGPATGFDVYHSSDLEQWEGPFPAFRPEADFWADRHYWAPEVYLYEGSFYMFASFKAEGKCRATQILKADNPLGPFVTITEAPVTPIDWECLDGTLHVDQDGTPWMIFCHEWLQVQDGKMCAIRLTKDLRSPDGEPVILFQASEAPWTKTWDGTTYVTDGPFIYKNQQEELLLLWSSGGEKGYTIGIARSASGNVVGPWTHEELPLYAEDGGHGMLFHKFDGELMLTIHTPNNSPNERAIFLPVTEREGSLKLK
ncbi:glycoside hydrolase family 43 protein [Paenibacillus aurantiacus]|uniref:Glycoside hydrolase family 43 protein n=1 Tax=Paenibacillus aurantiacus TaxID=1936118 RepID=A0ABV5KS36_9BACL